MSRSGHFMWVTALLPGTYRSRSGLARSGVSGPPSGGTISRAVSAPAQTAGFRAPAQAAVTPPAASLPGSGRFLPTAQCPLAHRIRDLPSPAGHAGDDGLFLPDISPAAEGQRREGSRRPTWRDALAAWPAARIIAAARPSSRTDRGTRRARGRASNIRHRRADPAPSCSVIHRTPGTPQPSRNPRACR